MTFENMKAASKKLHQLEDMRQGTWHLTVIQLVRITNLPMLSVSVLLMMKYGFANAAITLVLGNLILLGIRFSLISMCRGTQENTLDVARRYVGYTGGFIIAIVMLASTLAWFVEQTTIACNVLTFLIPINEGPNIDPYVQWSVYMGMLSTFLCMQGVLWLRWAAMIALPPILVCVVLAVILTPDMQLSQFPSTSFSLAGLPIILGASLGVSADLPTFFRHSASWKKSKKAIFLSQALGLAVGLLALCLVPVISSSSQTLLNSGMQTAHWPLKSTLVVLVILSVTAANIANIYSASVAWELVAPILSGRKEYLILGLGLTSIFILIAGAYSMDPLITLTDSGLINLCLVLVFGYFFVKKGKKELQSFDKWVLFLAWLGATSVNSLTYFQVVKLPVMSLVVALITLLAIIFTGYGSRWAVRSAIKQIT